MEKKAGWKKSRKTTTTTTTTTTATTATTLQAPGGPATSTVTSSYGGSSTPAAGTSSPAGGASTPRLSAPNYRSGGQSSDAATIRSAKRSSIFPAGDARNNNADTLAEIRNDMMVNYLYEQQLRRQYASGLDPYEGVVLKKSRGSFTCCPPQMAAIPGSLYAMVAQMNVRCAMTVNTPLVHTIVETLRSQAIDLDYVPLNDGLRVQILPTMADLPRGQLHHFAAFIEDVRMLVVWDDEPEKLMNRAADLELRFMEMIWGTGAEDDGDETPPGGQDEKKGAGGAIINTEELDPAQLEEALAREHRPVRLESACIVSLTLILVIVCLGLGWRALALETVIDGTFLRFALLLVAPIQFFVSLFFFQSLVGNLFQILGPISAVGMNSKYFSGKPPRRLNRSYHVLPHVTFQMPVYKEGLGAVIKPTVVSLKAAISTYEMQGGTANIFVNDDGMQLISDEDAQARRDFYDEHNIGWVARPTHRPKPDVEAGETLFLRRGKFKKASNMNYALHVSNRVEEKLGEVNRGSRWSADQERAAYHQCLADVLQEDEGRTWAEGNIRVGDYILIIDSDTRVPADCLLDAVSEMEQSPEVALMQFSSGVMNVTDSYFENGVTWFTNLIYSAITFAVACGDACPFVGHNAMLRWKAIQDAAAYTDEDGYEKYWSESHVSEDFDMALRLQVAGYSLRYAAYTGDGFKEGVSLTVYDELARWEKYAYGCNELLFHPFRFWLLRGPFTPLFKSFMWSSIPLPKKLTILAYIGTYYALAAVWCTSLANYFITGWFYGLYDKYYFDSFAIYVSIVVVFTGLGNVALAVLRYRLNERSLFGSLFENLKWIPMFTIFLGGISLHVSQAILSHFFEIDMAWGATAKEIEEVHFGQEIVRILRTFKWTFVYCFSCSALMVAGIYAFPHDWTIDKFFSIYPLATVVVSHFCLPVMLNPALMMFTW
ncbi:glycosyl transferase family group 2-domain-containing protein [Bombardia bombarda]|uniref:Glycosyl transferase family group 2-domain-containing protein n=1 Tax=Bombardia bombarda TaxID=252184 RepID=A0AA39XLH6_9PEZI|nr:glycosyl transferase family group 2-domain-containing protein [Bombardia bombarda]